LNFQGVVSNTDEPLAVFVRGQISGRGLLQAGGVGDQTDPIRN
jgi:hypothetical protein